MLFTSYSFIVFIAVLFVLYYIIPKKYQWILLLAASYFFYGLMSIKYLGYILVTTVTTFYAGRQLKRQNLYQKDYLKEHKADMSREDKKAFKEQIKKDKKIYFLACILVNFGILAFTKYTNFVIYNVNHISEMFGNDIVLSFWNIALPMGISFYTFKSMSYLIDIHRDKSQGANSLFKFALFVSFFPQIIQGPISRFEHLSKTLYGPHTFDYDRVAFGLQRILWGFFKKLVIADRLLIAVNTLKNSPEQYSGGFVLVLMLMYSFELYADFTGGIDIAIGIGQVFGVTIEENFNRPYFAKNITDFWRRWHITMGAWFRDYVFYPLSVSKRMLKLSKWARKNFGDAIGRRLPVYISTLIVWFTTGIWHGASWNFIAWGLANGIVIIISLELKPYYKWFHSKFNVADKRVFHAFQIIRTVLLVSSIRLFDVYKNVPLTFKMLGSMFTAQNYSSLFNGSLLELGLAMYDYVIVFGGLGVLLIVSLIQRKSNVRLQLASKPVHIRHAAFLMLILSLLVFGAYGAGYDASQFIYNQF